MLIALFAYTRVIYVSGSILTGTSTTSVVNEMIDKIEKSVDSHTHTAEIKNVQFTMPLCDSAFITYEIKAKEQVSKNCSEKLTHESTEP